MPSSTRMRKRLKRHFELVTRLSLAGALIFGGTTRGLAADQPSFTGKYSSVDKKNSPDNEVTLDVAQSADGIEVTETLQGKRTTNRFRLDGSEGDYVTPGGVRGRCHARLKKNQLVLEWLATVQPDGAARPVRQHTRERWQLSADSKTLTIQTDVDFPDFPSSVSAAVAGDTSGKRKYIRIGD